MKFLNYEIRKERKKHFGLYIRDCNTVIFSQHYPFLTIILLKYKLALLYYVNINSILISILIYQSYLSEPHQVYDFKFIKNKN